MGELLDLAVAIVRDLAGRLYASHETRSKPSVLWVTASLVHLHGVVLRLGLRVALSLRLRRTQDLVGPHIDKHRTLWGVHHLHIVRLCHLGHRLRTRITLLREAIYLLHLLRVALLWITLLRLTRLLGVQLLRTRRTHALLRAVHLATGLDIAGIRLLVHRHRLVGVVITVHGNFLLWFKVV